MPRAPRRRAPKVWRTASGQVMVRNSPAYIPPAELPAVLQLGMFNTAHDGDAALAITPKPPKAAPPSAPDPGYNQPGQGMAIIDAVLEANPLDESRLLDMATEYPADPAPAADAPAAKAKRGRKKKAAQDAPQEWPAECPPGYIVRPWGAHAWQPVRLAEPDQPGGTYFALMDHLDHAQISKVCPTEREAVEWLWKVALGKALEHLAASVRLAVRAHAEAATCGENDPPAARKRARSKAKPKA